MPRGKSVASQLKSLIRRLSKERAEHTAKIDEIDKTLAEFGIKPSEGKMLRRRRRKGMKKMGRPKGSKNKKTAKKSWRKASPKKQPAKKAEPLRRLPTSPKPEGV